MSVLGASQLGLFLVRRSTQPDFLHARIGKNCLLVLVADRPKLKSRMPGRLIGFCQKLAEVTLDYAHAHSFHQHQYFVAADKAEGVSRFECPTFGWGLCDLGVRLRANAKPHRSHRIPRFTRTDHTEERRVGKE